MLRTTNTARTARRIRCTAIGCALGFLLHAAAAAGSAQTVNAPADSSLDRANALIQAGDYGGAERALRELAQQQPDSIAVLDLMGYVLFQERKPRESLDRLLRAASSRPPRADVLKVMGLDCILLKDTAGADHYLTLSLEKDPSDTAAWFFLGRVKYTEGRFTDAVDAFVRVLQTEPRNVRAENNLGLALEGLNRTGEAVDAYRTAIVMDQGSAHLSEQPLLNLGILLSNQGKAREAMPLLERAAALAPGSAKTHFALGQAYTMLDHWEDARKQLEQAVALDAGDASLHLQLGKIYRHLGLKPQAEAEFSLSSRLLGSHASSDEPMP